MKILSTNINDFGGIICRQDYINKNKWTEWSSIDKSTNATEILAMIQKEAPTLCSLMEFELNGSQSQQFINSMDTLGYELVPIEPTSLKLPSITICFVRKDLLYKKIENPHYKKTNKVLRSTVIKVADYIIYFVHASSSYDEDFWNEISTFYNENKDNKILIIGDLNLYKLGTPQKEEYLQLVNAGIKDIWLELGNPNATPTYIKGGRLDYALASPKMLPNIFNMQINPSLMDMKVTDHSTLIIEC